MEIEQIVYQFFAYKIYYILMFYFRLLKEAFLAYCADSIFML